MLFEQMFKSHLKPTDNFYKNNNKNKFFCLAPQQLYYSYKSTEKMRFVYAYTHTCTRNQDERVNTEHVMFFFFLAWTVHC